MNFQPELALKVMDGEKTVTRRLANGRPTSPWFRGRCALRTYQSYAVCPGRGKPAVGRVEVIRLNREPLHLSMQPGEARKEGFPDHPAFQAAWEKINGDWDPMAAVWRVEFRVVETAECTCAEPRVPAQAEAAVDPELMGTYDRLCVWHGDYGLRVVTVHVNKGRTVPG